MHQDTIPSGPRASESPHIPEVLKSIPRWCTWRRRQNPAGKLTKAPNVSTVDGTRAPWADIAGVPLTADGGIGFVLTGRVTREHDGATLLALDVDACRHPQTGRLEQWAEELCEQYTSYTEVTPSGAGLRIWLWVVDAPGVFAKIRIPAAAPEGVAKTPEIQTFGCGPAGYVTVSGARLTSSPPVIRTFPDLDYLETKYDTAGVSIALAEHAALSVGKGLPPTLDEIDDAIYRVPDGVPMVGGLWEHLGLPSASELWWRLVRVTLRASRYHGAQAVTFLMTRTNFGRGCVDSMDPNRYASEVWVTRDVARIASKADEVDAAELFVDDFDPATWQPPATKPIDPLAEETPTEGSEKPATPLILDAGDYRDRLGSVQFLVYQLLPEQGIAQIFGAPASGKTPFAVSLALHVALGRRDWFGHAIDRPGKVLYMVGEDPVGVSDRLYGQLQAIDPGATLKGSGVYVTTQPGKLIDPHDAAKWVKATSAAVGEISLLVVDTLNANFGKGNENSTEDMSAVYRSLQFLSRRLRCLVLLVHHSGLADAKRARGSSVAFGALDAQFLVTKSGMRVTATADKNKNWQTPDPMVGDLVPVSIGTDSRGRTQTTVTLAAAGRAELAFAEIPDEVIEMRKIVDAVEDAAGRPMTKTRLAERTGLPRTSVRRRLTEAEGLELLAVEPPPSRGQGSVFRLGDPARRDRYFRDWEISELIGDVEKVGQPFNGEE